MELSLFDEAPLQTDSPVVVPTGEVSQPVAPVFTLKDAGGVEAALAFAQLVQSLNLADRITTGGKLDFAKLRRATNLLNRGVASDRPLPTSDDYESARMFLLLPSNETYANSYEKRGYPVPEEAAELLETLPADGQEGTVKT